MEGKIIRLKEYLDDVILDIDDPYDPDPSKLEAYENIRDILLREFEFLRSDEDEI